MSCSLWGLCLGFRSMNRKKVFLAASSAFALYVAIVIYLHVSPPTPEAMPPATIVLVLKRPFGRNYDDGLDYSVRAPSIDGLGDESDGAPPRSPFLLYEGGKLLGPGHSRWNDVRYLGKGRFLHLKDFGFIFSSSDGTSPSQNGRKYRVVLPIR